MAAAAGGSPRGTVLREVIIESEGSPLTNSALLCKHSLMYYIADKHCVCGLIDTSMLEIFRFGTRFTDILY